MMDKADKNNIRTLDIKSEINIKVEPVDCVDGIFPNDLSEHTDQTDSCSFNIDATNEGDINNSNIDNGIYVQIGIQNDIDVKIENDIDEKIENDIDGKIENDIDMKIEKCIESIKNKIHKLSAKDLSLLNKNGLFNKKFQESEFAKKVQDSNMDCGIELEYAFGDISNDQGSILHEVFGSSSSCSSNVEKFSEEKEIRLGTEGNNTDASYLLKAKKRKNKIYTCSYCPHSTRDGRNLKRHILTHTNPKMFKCSECDYESNWKKDLKRHLFRHTDIKLLKCSECDYEANSKADLNRHSFIHSDVKLFKCTECNYECNRKDQLKNHLLTHLNTKLFSCPVCGYGCNRKDRLKNHMKRHILLSPSVNENILENVANIPENSEDSATV